MKSTIKLITAALVALTLTGCGFSTIPPAHKGKILSTSGYSPEVIEPGRQWIGWNEKLVLLDTSTTTYKESIKVILADKLTLHVDIRFSGRISGSDKVINTMFNDINAGPDKRIAFDEVYKIYGQMVIRNKTREIINQYNVDEVHKNYKRIGQDIAATVTKTLMSTPLEISNIALGNVQYPEVVTEAVEMNEKRRLDIEKEKATQAIELLKRKNQQALALADYDIQITEAKAIRDKNKIIGEGITPELIKLRQLDVQVKMAEAMSKQGNNSVFVPYESLQSTGLNNRIYNSK
jgi:hypothetical protein